MTQNGRARKGDTKLIAALAAGGTVRNAAREAGVGERTAYRRLDDPEFRRRVNEARAEMVARAVGMLAEAATDAVTTLRQLSKSARSESVRLAAAKAVLEIGSRLRESELECRLVQLERRIYEQGNSSPRGAAGGISRA